MEKVIVSDSPHIRGKQTTKSIMIDVCIALLPATIAGIVYFGAYALLTLFITCATAVLTELVYSLCLGKKFIQIVKSFDFTSLVSGLLLGLCLSSKTPWYVSMLASIFAIAVVKMLFGGTGKNIVNPAITGRIFAFISFTTAMTSNWATPYFGALLPTEATGEIIAGATPLTQFLKGGVQSMGISNLDLFLGTGVMGCIGETCKLALIIGGIYLIARKVINWKWPTIYILGTGLFFVMFNGFNFNEFLPTILSGGLMLGGIFMATDYTTSPSCDKGRYVYYVALAILTALLRKFTKIEVVSFAILMMNLFVPLINTYIRPRIFGAPKLCEKIKIKIAENKSKKSANKEG